VSSESDVEKTGCKAAKIALSEGSLTMFHFFC